MLRKFQENTFKKFSKKSHFMQRNRAMLGCAYRVFPKDEIANQRAKDLIPFARSSRVAASFICLSSRLTSGSELSYFRFTELSSLLHC